MEKLLTDFRTEGLYAVGRKMIGTSKDRAKKLSTDQGIGMSYSGQSNCKGREKVDSHRTLMV